METKTTAKFCVLCWRPMSEMAMSKRLPLGGANRWPKPDQWSIPFHLRRSRMLREHKGKAHLCGWRLRRTLSVFLCSIPIHESISVCCCQSPVWTLGRFSIFVHIFIFHYFLYCYFFIKVFSPTISLSLLYSLSLPLLESLCHSSSGQPSHNLWHKSTIFTLVANSLVPLFSGPIFSFMICQGRIHVKSPLF